MREKKKTQKDMVLKYLQDFGKITSYEAFSELGVTRLSAKIFQLRKEGYLIVGEPKTNTNRYGRLVTFSEYHLVEL